MIQEAQLRSWLVEFLAHFLEIEPAAILPGRSFRDLGMNSADAVIVGGALEERFDVELDTTVFLRNESIDALVAELRQLGLVT